ncbi:DUF3912 family protein [Aliiglaciecola sp. CAU 1673]|uniref:DUF3912 family protein n=1 Tax=Aliiglaciecola sp. CAU 1673 TaxID=3032595 RepID=UPI0023DAED7E|nr:DUF3912 family protein [Aliiglaciecola sp. CAU 1673]MDF2177592.1 DUF3912 family protein [Aliiglaciecola sp. CAU 1673]
MPAAKDFVSALSQPGNLTGRHVFIKRGVHQGKIAKVLRVLEGNKLQLGKGDLGLSLIVLPREDVIYGLTRTPKGNVTRRAG